MELLITSKKDLTIFIKLMSYGSIFIISLILFIIGFGFYGIGSTHYDVIGPKDKPALHDIKLFNTNF
jgi:hypothetical protein